MQQTLDGRSWFERSRLKGALCFHKAKLGRLILWLLAILLGAQVISILACLTGRMDYIVSGVSADFATEMVLLLVFAFMLSKSSTTFLTRFGTARTPIWLSNLIALFVSGAVFLLGTLVLNTLINYVVLALSQSNASFAVKEMAGGREGAALIAASLGDSLRQLPQMLLWTLEWASLFYLLTCCYRRYKAITLTVCIVLPLALWLLMLLPMVREAFTAVENGGQSALILTGMKWLQALTKVVQFVRNNWQGIQGIAALAALPLSWLCMRSTAQP